MLFILMQKLFVELCIVYFCFLVWGFSVQWVVTNNFLRNKKHLLILIDFKYKQIIHQTWTVLLTSQVASHFYRAASDMRLCNSTGSLNEGHD